MAKTNVEKVHEAALAAGLPEDIARWAAAGICDVGNVATVAKSPLPTHLKKALLLNSSLFGGTDARMLAEFRNADDVQYLLTMDAGIPPSLRDIRQYVERDAAGNVTVMPFSKVGAQVQNAMAAADVHIDTSGPRDRDTLRQGSNNMFDELAVEVFAKLRDVRTEVAQ